MATGGLWNIAATALPVVALLLTAAWNYYKEWRAVHPRYESFEEREARSLQRGREILDRASEDYLDRLERENLRLKAECDELRFDRDRGWNLARWWESKAHTLRHQLANELFRVGKLDPIPMLPGLEDPEPKPPSLPMRSDP